MYFRLKSFPVKRKPIFIRENNLTCMNEEYLIENLHDVV